MKEWEKNVRRVNPYIAGEQPQEDNIIKLNTNENPYPPSPKVKKAYETTQVDKFALYPDPMSSELVQALDRKSVV